MRQARAKVKVFLSQDICGSRIKLLVIAVQGTLELAGECCSPFFFSFFFFFLFLSGVYMCWENQTFFYLAVRYQDRERKNHWWSMVGVSKTMCYLILCLFVCFLIYFIPSIAFLLKFPESCFNITILAKCMKPMEKQPGVAHLFGLIIHRDWDAQKHIFCCTCNVHKDGHYWFVFISFNNTRDLFPCRM